MQLRITTSPGLEDLVVDELRRAVGPSLAAALRPDGRAGHVDVSTDAPGLAAAALSLRSAHRVIRPVVVFRVAGDTLLDTIREEVAAAAVGIPELDPPEVSFRVTSQRWGEHAVTSEDVQRAAGAGVRAARWRAVRLVGADVELRCDLRDDVCTLGVQLNAATLSRRDSGPFRPTTSLKPNVAWGLLELARGDVAPARLLDPFMGGGTVLLEAAARWPGVALAGSDLHARCVEGVGANLAAAGVTAALRLGDARALPAVWPEGGFDTIVTNPPFGRRLGRSVDLEGMYRSFLRGAAEVCAGDARLVALVERRGAFNRALRGSGWATRHVRIIELGGVYAGAFVLARVNGGEA